jgi:hypothetical protein
MTFPMFSERKLKLKLKRKLKLKLKLNGLADMVLLVVDAASTPDSVYQ